MAIATRARGAHLGVNPEGLIEGIAARGLLIGGERVPKGRGGTYPHHDPTTGRLQAEVALAGADDVDDAVRAAREALPAWRAMPAQARGRILHRLADLLEAHDEEASVIRALEVGTPLSILSAGRYTADWTRYYAGWADKLDGQVLPVPGGLDYVVLEPYGVVGAVVPWNGSMMGMGHKVAPALAAGNTVVCKPPELAPFGVYRFAELALEAGLPPGVLNVVAGGAEAGEALVRHPDVAKVSFTGGIATARKVIAAAAEHITPLVLELGGKTANIVFPDADLDAAIPASAMGFCVLSGQGCALPTRLYVHDDVYDEVVERLVATVRATPVGDPLEPTTVVGPVINAAACARIEGILREAIAEGQGRLLTGGERLGGDLAEGYFIAPTVFGDVDQHARIAREEIFGPVLSVLRFSDEDEVVAKANDSVYALSASVHTRDLARAHRLARALDGGTVSINGGAGGPVVPFGGMKQSGYGREGARAGIEEFVQRKNVFVDF